MADEIEKKAQVPFQLRGVYRMVLFQIGDRLANSFKETGIMDENDDAKPPATKEGLAALIRAFASGVLLSFSRAEMRIPADYAVEEIILADSIVDAFGQPITSVLDKKNILVRFDGVGPLVRSIQGPLDVDATISVRENAVTPTLDVQLGPRLIISGRGLIETNPIDDSLPHLRTRM